MHLKIPLLLINGLQIFLTSSLSAPNCAVLGRESLVPAVTPSLSLSESVGFEPELLRLSGLVKLGDPLEFSELPTNNNFIKTKSLFACLILGNPIEWSKFKQSKQFLPGDGQVIMDGLFSRIDTREHNVGKTKTAIQMEGCEFDDKVFFGTQQCSDKLAEKSLLAGTTATSYGTISNTLIVPIVESGVTRFLQTDSSNVTGKEMFCNATPLTKLLINLRKVKLEIFCSIQNLLDILSPVNNPTECSSLAYRLARLELKDTKGWKTKIPAKCKEFPEFDCQNAGKRASPLGAVVKNVIGQAGGQLVQNVVTTLLAKVKSASKSSSAGLAEEVKYETEMSKGHVLLSIRLENKFSAFRRKNKLHAAQIQQWARTLELESRLTLQSFYDKYKMILDKLTSDSLSCSLNGDGYSFTCSKNAILDKSTFSKIGINSEKSKFQLGQVYFINCFSKDGINFMGNREVFLSIDGNYVNPNFTVPKGCVQRESFDEDSCKEFFSENFEDNVKIIDDIEIIAVNDSTIQLSSQRDFTVESKDHEIRASGKLFEIELRHFPLIVSGAGGSLQISTTSLTKMAKTSVQQIFMRAMPTLRQLALKLSDKNKSHKPKTESNWFLSSPYHYITTVIGAIVGLWTLSQLARLLMHCKMRYLFKKKWKKKKSDKHEVAGDCHMPTLHTMSKFDRAQYREQLCQYMSGNSTGIEEADAKLFDLVDKSLQKVDRNINKWVRTKDKDERTDLLFEMGWVLHSDLANRLCLCEFPVHVCVKEVAQPERYAKSSLKGVKTALTTKLPSKLKPTASAPKLEPKADEGKPLVTFNL